MEWAWSPAEIIVNTYCKLLSECSFKGVMTWLSDNFVTPFYKMIFKEDPPCMSKEVTEALIDITDWYSSLFGTFIRMFSAEKPPHVLPNFPLDILVMQEVAYHITTILTARLDQKKKAHWLTLPLQIGLYEICSFKRVDVEVE